MSTVFDDLINGFVAQLSAGTPVCDFIETDEDSDPLPAGRLASITVTLGAAQPQQLGGIAGQPVDWVTEVALRCFAASTGTSARPAANALAASVYQRLAAAPDLGLDPAKGVFIGEPRIDWTSQRAETRLAAATLVYSVAHRTTFATLD